MNFAYGDKYAAFLHDAVLLYATALNETMAKGLDRVKRLRCLLWLTEDEAQRTDLSLLEAMTKGLDYRSGVVVASQMRKKLFSGLWRGVSW